MTLHWDAFKWKWGCRRGACTCSSMSLGRSSCSSIVKIALLISSFESFNLETTNDPHEQLGHNSFQTRVTVLQGAHLDRRMLQFWARRPSMTDSSLTFLELSVSSSASFCQQSHEAVRIRKDFNVIWKKNCTCSHQHATMKGNLRFKRTKNTVKEHSRCMQTQISTNRVVQREVKGGDLTGNTTTI